MAIKLGKKKSGGDEEKEAKQPLQKKKAEMPAFVRPLLKWSCIVLLLLLLVVMILARVTGSATLEKPEGVIAQVVSPVQTFFANITDGIVSYLRTLKLRSNIEYEYNQLKAENEQLVYQAMLADELQVKLATYEDLYDELSANESMNPIMCTVIGKDDGNYFSVFTINKGLNDGIEDYMAVTVSGALVGYTYSTMATSAKVRTIIDSEASIAGLIQSSRDQGTVRGTLGVNGEAMCRMYYLPDDNLPRPGDTVVTSGVGMSFPKGIPIGTVRESTRGMEANKQYIVVEPTVDFQHIEYVIVLRYKPTAENVTGRANTSTYTSYVPLETARPQVVLDVVSGGNFLGTETADPNADPNAQPTESLVPTTTPAPATPTPLPTPTADVSGNLEYVNPNVTTAAPTDTPTPSPTPEVTYSPDNMTVEAD